MSATVCITDQERAQGRISSPHIQNAIAALHHEGLLVLDNVFDVELAQSTKFSTAERKDLMQERALFGLTQSSESRLCLCLGPLLAQIAAVRLGSRAEAVSHYQRKPASYVTKRVDSFIGLGDNNLQPTRYARITALSFGIVLERATLHFETKGSTRDATIHQHALDPGSVVVWNIHHIEPKISQSEATREGTLSQRSPERPVWVQTFLGMRNSRCLQCGVFNLDIAEHIQGCAANFV
jgi:hypothetical protein